MENLFTLNLSYLDQTGTRQYLDLSIDPNDITIISHTSLENDNAGDTFSYKGWLSNSSSSIPEGLCGKWSIPVELVYELHQDHSDSTWPNGIKIDLFSLTEKGAHERTIFQGSGRHENKDTSLEGIYYDYNGTHPAEITMLELDQYFLQNIDIAVV